VQRDILAESHIGAGNTPLDEDEIEGLIPSHLETRAELNQWEAKNLEIATEWIASRSLDVLDLGTLRELHRRMFGQTWTWAGSFRRSQKNISPYDWPEVPRLMTDLIANTRAQYEALAGDGEELDRLAARFHHDLVRIHPWPNGNGRHGRAATELLLRRWKRPPFTWGADSGSADATAIRARYIDALRRADAHEYTQLYEFVRA
jgi:Fic-DOC domain mobile mystery protein B